MDIVIISEFCGDFSETDNDRFLYLAKLLAKNSEHQIEIITSSFRHETKRQRDDRTAEWPFKVIYIDEPGYPRNICLKRFYSHYVWGKKVASYLAKQKKPDVVYCAVPSLTGPNLVAKYCEKNHIPFIVDVQDLWPEAFQLVLNIPVISGIIFAPFKVLADGIYSRADAICAVSDTYCKRALSVSRKCKDSTTVFLGTQLQTFDCFSSGKPILDKNKDEIWLAYCGTLGSSYDLTCVIDALALMNNSRVRMIVMGDGPRLEEFKDYAKQKGINAEFTGRLPYNEMCSLLKNCDLNVNPIAHGAAQSIINKHADYAASGHPVISTQESPEYRKLVDEYAMGFNCVNNNPGDLADKMRLLIDDEALRAKMGQNARKCAEECFDRAHTYKELVKIITGE